jgi:hypothetical protein
MSVLNCAEVRELAPELALGILGGADRADVVLHVNGCARCQAYVAELTEAADVLPQLVPEVEPPVGFEARTLRRLDDDTRRARRRWVASIAAVAAAVAILSITIVRVVDAGDDATTAARATTTSAGSQTGVPVSVAMEGGQVPAPAGWAYVTDGHGVAIAVDYGVAAGDYLVRVEPTTGAATGIGTMTIDGNRGSWTGRSEPALTTGARIALVDDTGTEVCHGTIPAAG